MPNKRDFLRSVLGVSATALLPNSIFAAPAPLGAAQEPLLPKRLQKGDTIGLVAPGYAFPEKIIKEVRTLLETLGYKPYHTPRLLQPHGYFSNTDKERAADLNQMFGNPKVDAILCIRGGYGCTRILSSLDYAAIRANPKPLIGFSDVTALLNGIHKMTGLITFHGPVGSTLDDPFSIASLLNVLDPKSATPEITNADVDPKQKRDPVFERYVICPGSATGALCGGSLTLINALIGTPHEVDFTHKLVCIEDIDEDPYRIDRMLTQLLEGPTFKKAAAIIFGVCAGCDESTNPNSFSLKEVILDRITPLGIPSAYGMSFGHIPQNFTFPIGAKATFSTDTLSLKISETYLQRT